MTRVMPGLVPGIHVLTAPPTGKTWMAGRKPGHDKLRSSLAGRRVLNVELAHVARDDEVVVVELQRPRDAILVKLERDGIDRGLLLTLGIVAVEIADRHRPAGEALERRLSGSGVGRHLLVGRDGAADQRHGTVDLL